MSGSILTDGDAVIDPRRTPEALNSADGPKSRQTRFETDFEPLATLSLLRRSHSPTYFPHGGDAAAATTLRRQSQLHPGGRNGALLVGVMITGSCV